MKERKPRAMNIREREWDKRKDRIMALRQGPIPGSYIDNIVKVISDKEKGFDPSPKQLRTMLLKWAEDEKSEQSQPDRKDNHPSLGISPYYLTNAEPLSTQYQAAAAVGSSSMHMGLLSNQYLGGYHQEGIDLSSEPHRSYIKNGGVATRNSQSTAYHGGNSGDKVCINEDFIFYNSTQTAVDFSSNNDCLEEENGCFLNLGNS